MALPRGLIFAALRVRVGAIIVLIAACLPMAQAVYGIRAACHNAGYGPSTACHFPAIVVCPLVFLFAQRMFFRTANAARHKRVPPQHHAIPCPDAYIQNALTVIRPNENHVVSTAYHQTNASPSGDRRYRPRNRCVEASAATCPTRAVPAWIEHIANLVPNCRGCPRERGHAAKKDTFYATNGASGAHQSRERKRP
jgi:hypothetical protein